MTTEKFIEDLRQAHLELKAAMAEVMVLVNAGKAFGSNWHTAVERERKAHEAIKRLLDRPRSQAGGMSEGASTPEGPYSEE
jgi:hypothetical protein